MPVAIRRPPPPRARGDGGGGGSGWVRLISARDDIDAHLLIGRLGEAGVETRTVKDRSAPGAWLYGGSNPWAPVTVLVRRRQLEAARLVLAEVAWDAPAADPATGGSPRRRVLGAPLLWWVVALALGLVLTGLALAETARRVPSCGLEVLCEGPTGSGR